MKSSFLEATINISLIHTMIVCYNFFIIIYRA